MKYSLTRLGYVRRSGGKGLGKVTINNVRRGRRYLRHMRIFTKDDWTNVYMHNVRHYKSTYLGKNTYILRRKWKLFRNKGK